MRGTTVQVTEICKTEGWELGPPHPPPHPPPLCALCNISDAGIGGTAHSRLLLHLGCSKHVRQSLCSVYMEFIPQVSPVCIPATKR